MQIVDRSGQVICNAESGFLGRTDFSDLNLTDADFHGKDLSLAYFRDTVLVGANFRDADLRVADFNGADLTNADFRGAKLHQAEFSGANLTGAKFDFEVPIVENLHSRIPLREVEMSTWHEECGTAHCHAGWATYLADEAGELLEDQVGPSVAGALIITRSCPYLNGRAPEFYVRNEYAIDTIREYAAIERGKR